MLNLRCGVIHYFSNFSLCKNHLGGSLKCRFLGPHVRFWFSSLGWGPWTCISTELPGDGAAAGPWTPQWVAQMQAMWYNNKGTLKDSLQMFASLKYIWQKWTKVLKWETAWWWQGSCARICKHPTALPPGSMHIMMVRRAWGPGLE